MSCEFKHKIVVYRIGGLGWLYARLSQSAVTIQQGRVCRGDGKYRHNQNEEISLI